MISLFDEEQIMDVFVKDKVREELTNQKTRKKSS
jgi:hypothetical protein